MATVWGTRTPKIYKLAAKILTEFENKKSSLQSLVNAAKHPRKSALISITTNVVINKDLLDGLMKVVDLGKICQYNPNLVRVILYEAIILDKDVEATALCNTIKRNKTLLKNHLEELQNSVKKPDKPLSIPKYGRINTLKTTKEEVLNCLVEEGCQLVELKANIKYRKFIKHLKKLQENEFIEDIHIPDLLSFQFKTNFHGHFLHENGYLLVQNKASCIPVLLLNPPPGSVVIDCCAAPGMKATHLAALMQNTGKIIAVDRSEERMQTLKNIVHAAGVTCVQPEVKDFTSIDPNSEPYKDVEYLLLDPTCSGSGIFRRVELTQQVDEDRLKNLSFCQSALLKHALSFPKIRRLVYSTCSIHKQENEDVVTGVLNTFEGRFRVVKNERFPDFVRRNSGAANDVEADDGQLEEEEEEEAKNNDFVWTYPDRDLCNGFFVAVIEPVDISTEKGKRKKNKKRERNANDDDDVTQIIINDQEPEQIAHPQKKKKKKEKNRE